MKWWYLISFLEEYKISYTNALLLGIKEASQNSIEYNEDIEEVSLLCKTLGLQIVEECQHNLRKVYPATYISKQKASEIINKAKELNCDNIVINAEITPGQMKNLQDIAGFEIRILDRTGIIIDILVLLLNIIAK